MYQGKRTKITNKNFIYFHSFVIENKTLIFNDFKLKFAWLSRILNMENGVPSHDIFNRFFRLLAPEEFEKHFIKWVQSIIGKVDYEFVSIDGKTIRRASKMKGNGSIHIVSAWANLNEVTLG